MPKTKAAPTITDQLISTIRDRGLTAYAVAKASGVHVSVVQRLIDRERSPKLETIDRICTALRLELRAVEGE